MLLKGVLLALNTGHLPLHPIYWQTPNPSLNGLPLSAINLRSTSKVIERLSITVLGTNIPNKTQRLHHHRSNLQVFLTLHDPGSPSGAILCVSRRGRPPASAVYCAEKMTSQKSSRGDGAF